MAVGKACHILVALLVVWLVWSASDAKAGVIIRIEPQGMFDFAGTAETAITYANAYLKRQAAEKPVGEELHFQWSSQAALDNLERQLQQAPGDLDLQTALGVTLMGASLPKEAQRVFEQSVRANPSYAIGHCYLAYLALLEDDRSGFGRHFQQAIHADPTYVPAYNNLAIFYNKIGKTDAALRTLTQGIARFPKEASWFYNQALVYFRQKHWEAAEVSLRNALARNPLDNTYLVLGMILVKRGQHARAQMVFESILETNPKNTFALAGLADSYKGRHDFEKAIALIKQAIAIAPTNKDLHDELHMHQEAAETWKQQGNAQEVK